MKKLLRTLNHLGKAFRNESRPKLDIQELEKVTRSEVMELVDWELKQGEERQKLFGVGSWSLLVGLAGTIWATASLPTLGAASLGRVALAFVLLESSLAALRTVWTAATKTPEMLDLNRALRMSIVGGTETNVSPALSIFQSGLLLMATLCWNEPQMKIASGCVCSLLLLSILGNALVLVLLRVDFPIIVWPNTNPSRHLRPIFITTGYVVIAIAVPLIAWGWTGATSRFPPLLDWQVAGLVVAGAYLLRQLLSSQAQARHQDFLRHLRRDLALGFETPSQAAEKMAWRLSGFPAEIYVKGRFRALTAELKTLKALLDKASEQIEKAVEDLKKPDNVKIEIVRTAAARFFADQIKGSTGRNFGLMGNSQAALFFAIGGDAAKGTEDFKKWDATRLEAEAAGKRYEKAYQELEVLLQNTGAGPYDRGQKE